MRVLMITCEWPDETRQHLAPFVVRQVEFLRKAGVDVDVFAFRGAKNPMNYAKAWLCVRRKIRSGMYDLVHAQWGQSGLIAIPTRLPLVVTDRGGEGDTVLGRILRAIGSWVAHRADELVVVSSHLRRYLPDRPCEVIPSGLDFARLRLVSVAEARRTLDLPASKPLVLFVGNPDDGRKRYRLAREVFARLPARLDAELLVVWGVPHERVITYMNACDALLFTSRWEGSPNVIKEAMACNLPFVSTDVGDVQERAKGVEGCMVCADDDPQVMASALTVILERRQRTNGRCAVVDLDESHLAQQMIAIYRRALSKAPRAQYA